jgi:uncharacterized membrane protein (DUF106 family)
MDALAEVRNEETRLQDAYLLRVSSILAPLLRLLHLLLVVRVLVFIVITVIELDMWRPFAIGRRKLRKLRLVVLHTVLVVLVLEDLRGVLLV